MPLNQSAGEGDSHEGIAFAEAHSSSGYEGHPPQPELTPRQRQILELLQVGKVNKEIANELGIGVGTVKQHVVALFKRLNVRNRTMAVSRGMGMLHSQHITGSAMLVDGVLERRPCIVLSVVLPDHAEHQAVRFMHGFLAALAYDHDALFLARKGNAGDVIFGVQRVTEFDLVKVLQVAHTIFLDIRRQFPDLASLMRGGITAGLAVASMKRFGGWSGEAVASAAIGMARDLAGNAPPESIRVSREALEVMRALGIDIGQDIGETLSFVSLDSLRWTGTRSCFSLIGRDAELNVLKAALRESSQGTGSLIVLRGEAGMGKSRMCNEIGRLCNELGGEAHSFHGQPDFLGGNTDSRSVDEVVNLLHSPPGGYPELIILDDFHLMDKEKQSSLWGGVTDSVGKGRMVIVATRRHVDPLPSHAKQIQLGKLSRDELADLVQAVLAQKMESMSPGGIQSIVDKAGGVPLFAVELAKHRGDWKKALMLMIVVSSRLDNLNLDRRLLNAVARNSGKVSLKDVGVVLNEDAGLLQQSLVRAESSGVILRGPDGRLSISHPLLRQLIEYLDME